MIAAKGKRPNAHPASFGNIAFKFGRPPHLIGPRRTRLDGNRRPVVVFKTFFIRKTFMEVRENLDIPAPLVPIAERQAVNRINAPRSPGGEVSVDLYRKVAPPGAGVTKRTPAD